MSLLNCHLRLYVKKSLQILFVLYDEESSCLFLHVELSTQLLFVFIHWEVPSLPVCRSVWWLARPSCGLEDIKTDFKSMGTECFVWFTWLKMGFTVDCCQQ
jgi:hypothetical protein